jgi:hypothetical protein
MTGTCETIFTELSAVMSLNVNPIVEGGLTGLIVPVRELAVMAGVNDRCVGSGGSSMLRVIGFCNA